MNDGGGHQDRATSGTGLAQETRRLLQRHVLSPLLPRCIDRDHGGFLTDFDERWRPAGPHEKSLEHAARTTIAFAQIAAAMPDPEVEAAVRHGCAFLQQAMWDGEHGGFYARVDRAGRPLWDGLKHPHAVTYAARAFLLAEPLLPPGDGLAWARRAQAWLDDVAWEKEHGGYWGSFRRDNRRHADGEHLPTPDGRDIFGLHSGMKEINSQGDGIDMLLAFLRREPRAKDRKRLAFFVELIADRLIQRGMLPYLYARDWRPLPELIRIGYQFMMARFLLDAGSTVGSPTAALRARELVDFALEAAAHPAGGFSYVMGGLGRNWPWASTSADTRQWWVQVEALYALHHLGESPVMDDASRPRYRRARDELWLLLRSRFFDETHGGMRQTIPEPASFLHRLRRCLQGLGQDGRPLKSHCWKDPSHEVAALIAIGQPAVPV